jgi:hypothetical protein
MNRIEAIAALDAGEKLTHDYFQDDENIQLDKSLDMILTEDGYYLEKELFWKDRAGSQWDNGWNIWKA